MLPLRRGNVARERDTAHRDGATFVENAAAQRRAAAQPPAVNRGAARDLEILEDDRDARTRQACNLEGSISQTHGADRGALRAATDDRDRLVRQAAGVFDQHVVARPVVKRVGRRGIEWNRIAGITIGRGGRDGRAEVEADRR